MYGGYDEAGSFIFLVLVIVVNIRILIQSNVIDKFIILLQVICFVMYLATALVVSYTFYFDDQYKSYGHMFTFPAMYFSLILFTIVFAMSDKMFTFVRNKRKEATFIQLERADQKEKERLKQDPNQVRELLQTEYKHTGYAFSQEAGQNLLVTRAVIERSKTVVMRRL